jgi:hypothetical protein
VLDEPTFFFRSNQNYVLGAEVINILVGKTGEALKNECISNLRNPVNAELLLLDFLNLPKFQRDYFNIAT